MTVLELKIIINKQHLEDNAEVLIRICGQNNNEPISVDSFAIATDYNKSLILNCLEIEDLEDTNE